MRHKKDHERFILERFIAVSSLDANILEARESPDFLVSIAGETLGVEVTEIFVTHDISRGPMQVHESISARIVARARQFYDGSGAPPLHVSVCFAPRHDLRRLNMKQVAAQLASFARSLSLKEMERVIWRPSFQNDPLPREISYLQALRVPTQEMAHWHVARAGWVAPLTTDALQSCIDDKAARLAKYSAVAEKNWLLIAADMTKPSQLLEAQTDFDPSAVSSPFDRTFFFRFPLGEVIELGSFDTQQALARDVQDARA